MRKVWEYEALRIMVPSGHEHQSLVFVVGELHPPESIAPETRKKMGKVMSFDAMQGRVCVNFENAFLEFHDMAYVEIHIGQIKK